MLHLDESLEPGCGCVNGSRSRGQHAVHRMVHRTCDPPCRVCFCDGDAVWWLHQFEVVSPEAESGTDGFEAKLTC